MVREEKLTGCVVSTFFELFRAYFPCHLHKTADLDPSKNYLFGYHPHGILSVGAFITFGTETTGWSKLFPGIDARLCTLPAQFLTPFWREILLAMGLRNSSPASCTNGLTHTKGSSIVLVIGGAQESLFSRPGTADLCLKKRKGFVKVALRAGAGLVPVFAFGETDLWDQFPNPEGSLVRKIQDLSKKVITFTFPLINGRGVFQYGWGLLPHRRPINVVVGAPIDLPKIDKPTQEDIDKYHLQYVNSLEQLYNTHKAEYSPNRKSDIVFRE